jgi:DNA end-binding protein Ku
MPSRALETAAISFGLVTIPVKVHSATRRVDSVGSHMLHATCGTRLKTQLFCPKDKEVVPRSEVSRGFEVEPDRYVQLSDEEVKGTVENSEAIDIGEFVPLEAVDLTAYESAYYLVPAGKSGSAFALLHHAMRDKGLVAIGEHAARGRENLVLLRPGERTIVMHRLRRAEQLRDESEFPALKASLKPGELELAEELIGKLEEKTFDPARHTDDRRKRLDALVAEKKKTRGTVVSEGEEASSEGKSGKVVDLMAALRASVEGARAAPARRPRRVGHATRKPAARRKRGGA